MIFLQGMKKKPPSVCSAIPSKSSVVSCSRSMEGGRAGLGTGVEREEQAVAEGYRSDSAGSTPPAQLRHMKEDFIQLEHIACSFGADHAD